MLINTQWTWGKSQVPPPSGHTDIALIWVRMCIVSCSCHTHTHTHAHTHTHTHTHTQHCAGEPILPEPRSATECWRMIHFKYKKNRGMMHVMDGYDFATERHQQDFLLTRIPAGTRGKVDLHVVTTSTVKHGHSFFWPLVATPHITSCWLVERLRQCMTSLVGKE